ncbi:MAG: phosphatidylserine decarboxylase family protein [Chitinophagales bacterium]|nr:phosphatidylserine decarboxylase family protein [Chitinophagales bacterium]
MKRVYIHREGHRFLLKTLLVLFALNFALHIAPLPDWVTIWSAALSLLVFGFVVYFFRFTKVSLEHIQDNTIIAPADGRIVAIEEVLESEYFQDRRLQVSIFMSPANVHVNRNPVSGTVKYTRYHPGNYLVAWHPKSSTLNERFTSVIESADSETEILIRQIAGKVARKISNYLDEGEQVKRGSEMGFIKFGSRVDLFLPLNAKIKVQLKEKVKGGITILAELPEYLPS